MVTVAYGAMLIGRLGQNGELRRFQGLFVGRKLQAPGYPLVIIVKSSRFCVSAPPARLMLMGMLISRRHHPVRGASPSTIVTKRAPIMVLHDASGSGIRSGARADTQDVTASFCSSSLASFGPFF